MSLAQTLIVSEGAQEGQTSPFHWGSSEFQIHLLVNSLFEMHDCNRNTQHLAIALHQISDDMI